MDQNYTQNTLDAERHFTRGLSLPAYPSPRSAETSFSTSSTVNLSAGHTFTLDHPYSTHDPTLSGDPSLLSSPIDNDYPDRFYTATANRPCMILRLRVPPSLRKTWVENDPVVNTEDSPTKSEKQDADAARPPIKLRLKIWPETRARWEREDQEKLLKEKEKLRRRERKRARRARRRVMEDAIYWQAVLEGWDRVSESE
jgi:hypothetical protein